MYRASANRIAGTESNASVHVSTLSISPPPAETPPNSAGTRNARAVAAASNRTVKGWSRCGSDGVIGVTQRRQPVPQRLGIRGGEAGDAHGRAAAPGRVHDDGREAQRA